VTLVSPFSFAFSGFFVLLLRVFKDENFVFFFFILFFYLLSPFSPFDVLLYASQGEERRFLLKIRAPLSVRLQNEKGRNFCPF
jgi:hypothetical protein